MIQIRLWNDCINNCSFCSIKNKGFTRKEDKIKRLEKITSIKNTKIGIIGGEFFEGQLKGIEKEWLAAISKIECDELFITANLINEQYLLKETLKIRPDVIICTSYDTIGRFKNDYQKEIWLDRVNSIKNIFCTIIPTQDMVTDKFIDRIKCRINLCEPHLGLEWLKNVDKKEYHKHLIEENRIFNLPKRNDLLRWIIKHPDTIDLMKNYKYNHSKMIISFDNGNNFTYEYYNRFKDDNFISNCGHPYFSRCYADSEKCLMCDIEEI